MRPLPVRCACVFALLTEVAARKWRHSPPTPTPAEDNLQGVFEAYASSFWPYKIVAALTSLFGLVALVNNNLTRLFQKQTAWTTGVYIMLAAVFCWSLLNSIWIVVWPLSGAQMLFTGDNDGLHVACSALTLFGPERILNVLLTCVIVLFAPVVLIPPRQPAMQEKGTLPEWTHRTLVRMYAIVLIAQIWNLWYVYEFFQLNMASMAALEERVNAFAREQVSFAKQATGIGLEDLTPSVLSSNAFNDLTPISAMVLYVVVLWSALIITYERLTRRRFNTDFPQRFVLLLFPCLKRFSACVGQVATHYASGHDHVVAFFDRIKVARGLIVLGPDKMSEAIDRVTAAFLEAKRAVISACKAAKREMDKHHKDPLKVLKSFIHAEVDARLAAFLHWKESEHHYFEQLESFLFEGVEGMDMDFDDGETGEAEGISKLGDAPALPTSSFPPFVVKLIRGAIDVLLAVAPQKEKPEKMVDSFREAVCNDIDHLSTDVVGRMRFARKELEKLATKVEALSTQVGDFADAPEALTHQADVLVKIVSTLSFAAHWYYPHVYSFLFGALTFVAYGFKVMTFSMVFIFWQRWSLDVQAVVVGMLVLFGIMIAFNCVFFAEALAGRLGRIKRRGAELRRVVKVLNCGHVDPHDDCGESASLLGDMEEHTDVAAPADGGAQTSQPMPKPDQQDQAGGAGEFVQDTVKAWRLVVLQPAIAILLIVLGAAALAAQSGLKPDVCRW